MVGVWVLTYSWLSDKTVRLNGTWYQTRFISEHTHPALVSPFLSPGIRVCPVMPCSETEGLSSHDCSSPGGGFLMPFMEGLPSLKSKSTHKNKIEGKGNKYWRVWCLSDAESPHLSSVSPTCVLLYFPVSLFVQRPESSRSSFHPCEARPCHILQEPSPGSKAHRTFDDMLELIFLPPPPKSHQGNSSFSRKDDLSVFHVFIFKNFNSDQNAAEVFMT